ncbi:hypothetical protein GCM10027187_47660 [Streptosporangium sandarakinum]
MVVRLYRPGLTPARPERERRAARRSHPGPGSAPARDPTSRPPAAPAGRQVADATGTSRIGALQSHSSVT